MRHFYLIWNPNKPGTEAMAEEIRGYLERRGGICVISPARPCQMNNSPARPCQMNNSPAHPCQMNNSPARSCQTDSSPVRFCQADNSQPRSCQTDGFPTHSCPADDSQVHTHRILPSHTDASQVPADTECVITLGGDGTLIRAARDLCARRIPMLGINMGHLGYLTQVGCQEPGEVLQMLDDLMAGQFQLEKRMMLKGTICRGGAVVGEDIALNEILISRREMPKILNLRLAVNGEPLCDYKADGMIIATPTGSTAYNLSAGGPIVAPSAQMTILTPICPHELNGRSIVLPAQDRIEIEVAGNDDEGQAVVFDGGAAVPLRVGDVLAVEKSRMETVMVKLSKVSFVDNLRSKMAGK